MSLPKINDSVYYESKVPSTGKKIKFRPYYVKEEKTLMTAFETGDQKLALSTVVDTIKTCVKDGVNNLTTFDVEYLFSQIRAKSVGEKSRIIIKCPHCESENEHEVDVSKVNVVFPKGVKNTVNLPGNIAIKLRYPSYEHILGFDFNEADNIEMSFALSVKCIESIQTEDELILADDCKQEELVEFVESMTSQQFEEIANFIREIPTLKHKVNINCVGCSKPFFKELSGIQDFL